MQVSVSTMESFRLLQKEYWQTEEKLIAEIRRERPPTRKMAIGTAFHSVLEKPESYLQPGGEYACDGFTFPASVVHPCLAIFDRRGVFEASAYTDWRVGGRTITTSARVDQLIGLHIKENKTKTGQFQAGYFDQSLQWRFYIPMFGAKSVTYNVFLLSDNESKGISLRGIETVTYYPYEGQEAECKEWLAEFAEWAERKSLLPWLVPSWLRPKPAAESVK